MGRLKLWITFSFITLFFYFMYAQENFLAEQLRFERVQMAYTASFENLKNDLSSKNILFSSYSLLFRAFKAEGELEIWIKNENTDFQLFKTYKICKPSGTLGPKYKQGDKQVPEGYYYIDRFNPVSNFWLSLGINYPNMADSIRSTATNLGGDIFIHGNCVTVGCLPMTNEKMNEIYILSVLAKNGGQEKIPIHIYPYRFSEIKNSIFENMFTKYADFWKTIEKEYNYFNENHKIPQINVNNEGNYVFDY